jgi:HK97 family phage prohead protease
MMKYWSGDDASLKAAKRLEPTPGSILDFEAVISTSKRDRDFDTLLASGGEIDEHAALLWQHIPASPIGRLIRITEQNEKRVCGHFAVADTALGRDAKTLIEFGALRISHGFKPIKAEPHKDGNGYVISSWKCLEISVVSVPANEGATILQHTSGVKFYSPEGRKWAESLSQQSEFDRLLAANFQGRSRTDLLNDDLYRSMGCLSPWERERQWAAQAAAKHAPPAPVATLDTRHEMLKELGDIQGKLVFALQECQDATQRK